MITVADLATWLERFAPSRLAESWDNVGLLWGDPRAEVHKVMTCLTVTPDSAAEAIEEGAGAIVSHHPILFRAVKAVRADRPETAMLWDLARAGVAVLSPHTAFDNTEGGINDGLAQRLGLLDMAPLRPAPPRPLYKVVVFAPDADREPVLAAAFAAGAGRIGNYDECSYSSEGFGTFFGTEGTNPAVGQAGRRETVREWRIEVLCPGDRLAAVLAAIRAKHSYEEPAIDVYPLQATPEGPGLGRVGRLAEPMTLEELARRLAQVLQAPGLHYVGDPGARVERVALACGAGDDFLGDAHRVGADCLLTGEARFHRALEARALGLGLILAGHFATERPGIEDLAARLVDAFPSLTIWASRRERDPLVLVS
ncbi:MAG: Nif3-like dinuclear metal center hexameric protein [Isosphaeraceae bacterium]|nr:Nif3-like dinuclear metal center hexameric protein [Isosphaeraceae bacterium]